VKEIADYRLHLRVRNNRILSMMEHYGYDSVPKFSKMIGISYGTVNQYITQKILPTDKFGEWKETAVKIADALKVTPDMLFSEHQKTVRVLRNTAEIAFNDISAANRLSNNPETLMIEGGWDLRKKLKESLETLTPKERQVLELRFGLNGNKEHTLEEASEFMVNSYTGEVGISKDRVRQIEAKAFRKLRHPTRGGALRGFLDLDDAEPVRKAKSWTTGKETPHIRKTNTVEDTFVHTPVEEVLPELSEDEKREAREGYDRLMAFMAKNYGL
jgi:hypothetical protein